MNYLDLDLLENPYGKRVGGGYDTVRVGSGGRLHIQGRDGGPLCMQGRKTTDLRASTGRVVDCYRCIKILAMESNAPYIRRELTTAKGEKKSHFMVPGGRQGQLVADKKASPSGMSGVAPFKRGPTQHPTQPWMTKRVAMAKTYEERLSDEGVALPPYFLPPTPEEKEAAQAFSYYASPKAKRRAAAAARRAGGAAAAAQVANPRHARHGLPYMTFGNPSDEVMYTRSGMAYIVGADGKPRFVARSQAQKGIYDKRKRSSYVEESDAAKAMRLFHSGQAFSLKTAWDAVKIDRDASDEIHAIIEGKRRANGRRSR